MVKIFLSSRLQFVFQLHYLTELQMFKWQGIFLNNCPSKRDSAFQLTLHQHGSASRSDQEDEGPEAGQNLGICLMTSSFKAVKKKVPCSPIKVNGCSPSTGKYIDAKRMYEKLTTLMCDK